MRGRVMRGRTIVEGTRAWDFGSASSQYRRAQAGSATNPLPWLRTCRTS